jgi:hypothetical protein
MDKKWVEIIFAKVREGKADALRELIAWNMAYHKRRGLKVPRHFISEDEKYLVVLTEYSSREEYKRAEEEWESSEDKIEFEKLATHSLESGRGRIYYEVINEPS